MGEQQRKLAENVKELLAAKDSYQAAQRHYTTAKRNFEDEQVAEREKDVKQAVFHDAATVADALALMQQYDYRAGSVKELANLYKRPLDSIEKGMKRVTDSFKEFNGLVPTNSQLAATKVVAKMFHEAKKKPSKCLRC